MFPDVQDDPILNLNANQISFVRYSRFYYIPISHAALVMSNWIQEAKNLKLNRAKQIFSFASTLLMVLQNFLFSRLIGLFPLDFEQQENNGLTAVYIWFEIEWVVFISTLMSNCIFLMLRSCMHHKVKVEEVPERMQLPGIDTIVAIETVVNTFNSQYVPAIISISIFTLSGE
jgi:hypothetical protein